MRILLTSGNINDIVPAKSLLEGLSGEKLLADRAYDADKLIEFAKIQQLELVIPPKKNRKHKRKYDKHTYKERHLVECVFAKLKVFRHVATRYDKLAITFKASVMIAACMIWLQ